MIELDYRKDEANRLPHSAGIPLFVYPAKFQSTKRKNGVSGGSVEPEVFRFPETVARNEAKRLGEQTSAIDRGNFLAVS